jgi:hypothetical protein
MRTQVWRREGVLVENPGVDHYGRASTKEIDAPCMRMEGRV